MWPLLLMRTWKEVWGTSCLRVSFRLMAPASIYARLQEGNLILAAYFLPIVEIQTNNNYAGPFGYISSCNKEDKCDARTPQVKAGKKEGHMHLDDGDALNIVLQLKFNEASSFCSATAVAVHVAVHTLCSSCTSSGAQSSSPSLLPLGCIFKNKRHEKYNSVFKK